MPAHDELGKRMKVNYESVTKTRLVRRMPVCIRIDGKAFHSWVRGLRKPFDSVLMASMQETMKFLCENIQGCVLGYTQSDEISLILVDYKKLTSDAWFDNEVQKMASVSASMATGAFNQQFYRMSQSFINDFDDLDPKIRHADRDTTEYVITLIKKQSIPAFFDSRVFNIPREEVTNLIYWRQIDATRNSIESVGQAYFSHKELHKKTCNQIQDMLHEQKGINWNDFSIPEKRGSCCIKEYYIMKKETNEEVPLEDVWRCSYKSTTDAVYAGMDLQLDDRYVLRSRWKVDEEIPIFRGDDRNYIERLIKYPEEG